VVLNYWSHLGLLSRLAIRAKTLSASVVLLICLIGMGVARYLTSSQVTRNLNAFSVSNLPTCGAAAAVNNAVIAAHMRVFRYVSWASNGVNEKLLGNLRKEIEGDFAAIQKTFQALVARPNLSIAEQTDLGALQTKLNEYQSTAKIRQYARLVD